MILKKSANGVMLRNGKRHSVLQKYGKKLTVPMNRQSRFITRNREKTFEIPL